MPSALQGAVVPAAVLTSMAVGVAASTKICSLLRERQKARQESMSYDLIIDISGAPERRPWAVLQPHPLEKTLDVLAVCVLGDYKVGKTFLINKVSNLNLPSSEAYHTRGLSIKRMAFPRHRLAWIDTAGQGAPYDIQSESANDRQALENLANDLAYQLSDVQIVVSSNCKMRDQELIYSMHQSMLTANRPGKSLLMVVHNFSRISDPGELEAAFQMDVVARFHVQRIGIPDRLDDSKTKFIWADRSDACPTYHFLLGQEGTPAGEKYNKQTYEAIFNMCIYRLGYNTVHNFLESTLFLMNNGLLQRHLNSDAHLSFNEATSQIVADTPAATASSLLPFSIQEITEEEDERRQSTATTCVESCNYSLGKLL